MRIRTPIGNLPWWTVVAGNAVFWPTWTLAVGYLAQRVDAERLRSDGFLTRPRDFERAGRWYRERLGIDRWKNRLPEAGAAFGGFPKRSVGSGEPMQLAQFAAETRRAEYAHWAMVAGVSVTALWNPWWAAPINGAVALGSNVPCIAVQRYNRARLVRILRRRAGDGTTSDQ